MERNLVEQLGYGKTWYYPIISFQSGDGRTLKFRDLRGFDPPVFVAGEAVKVSYLRDNPQETATIDRGIVDWKVPIMAGLGLSLLMYGPAITCIRYYRASQEKNL